MAEMAKPAETLANSGQVSVDRTVTVSDGDEAIKLLGEPRLAVKKALITIREPNGDMEIVNTSWGPQEAHKGKTHIAKDSKGEYPYDIEAFNKNMEEVPGKPGYYRKATHSKLIEIPVGVTVECVTIDQGQQKPMKITAPHFIGIGVKNEVYPVERSVFESDFDWK